MVERKLIKSTRMEKKASFWIKWMSLIKLSVFHIFTATTSNYRYDKPTLTLTVLDLVTLEANKTQQR